MPDLPLKSLAQAHFDCRRSKRNSRSALEFELHLERNLVQLHEDLVSGAYRIGPSVCFAVTRPKVREVWAAAYRDRVVHHLLYNAIAPRIHASFIADSCACIPGRGTLYAARRLEAMIRSASENWSKPTYYLKCDLANFFVSLDKHVLLEQLRARIPDPTWFALAELILMHDPRPAAVIRSPASLMARVPRHKSLLNQPSHRGLPIGNLSSQFFANIHLDALDQFVKHRLRARRYVRYVDDFIILDSSPRRLNEMKAEIERFLAERLRARLNPRKTVLQPISRGVDFVGQVIKPHRRSTRRRTVATALRRIERAQPDELQARIASYFGLMRQATANRADRARIARAALRRGASVNARFTRAFYAGNRERAAERGGNA